MLQTKMASEDGLMIKQRPQGSWTPGPPGAEGYYWLWQPIFAGSDMRNLSFVHLTQARVPDPREYLDGWFHMPVQLPGPPVDVPGTERS